MGACTGKSSAPPPAAAAAAARPVPPSLHTASLQRREVNPPRAPEAQAAGQDGDGAADSSSDGDGDGPESHRYEKFLSAKYRRYAQYGQLFHLEMSDSDADSAQGEEEEEEEQAGERLGEAVPVELSHDMLQTTLEGTAAMRWYTYNLRNKDPKFSWYYRLATASAITNFTSSLLTKAAGDFVSEASHTARLVVSELGLPPEKSVFRSDGKRLGGVAGGKKFVVGSILYKVAQDAQVGPGEYLYSCNARPDDARAAKSAGHDLRGATILSSAAAAVGLDGIISAPFQAVLDINGFRVVAMPLLPIDNKNTLVYGSGDGARTVHRSDKETNRIMSEIGEQLHIREHVVGQDGARLVTAGDVEVHLLSRAHRIAGMQRVILDTARCMPPEAFHIANHLPSSQRVAGNTVFYRLLRPELLARWKAKGEPALNPDALTNWGANDVDFAQHNMDVARATEYLVNDLVPEFAAWFVQQVAASIDDPQSLQERIVPEMHARGINARHVGLVRRHAMRVASEQHGADSTITQACGGLLLVEAVKRVLKSLLRRQLRAVSRSTHVERISEFEIQASVVSFLNKLVGSMSSVSSTAFWSACVFDNVSPLFGDVALEGLSDRFALRSHPWITKQLRHMIGYVLASVSMRLSSDCIIDLEEAVREDTVRGFYFCAADVEDGDVRVKTVSLFDVTRARSLEQQAGAVLKNDADEDADADEDYEEAESKRRARARLLRLSSAKYQSSVRMDSGNTLVRAMASCVEMDTLEERGYTGGADAAALAGLEALRDLRGPSVAASRATILARLQQIWNLRVVCDPSQFEASRGASSAEMTAFVDELRGELQARVNERDERGMTALHWATQLWLLDAMQYLVEVVGCDIELRGGPRGRTPLILACRNGDIDAVKYLCSSGANVERMSDMGLTPLIRAANNGHKHIVEFLVPRVDIEARGSNGWSALSAASRHGHTDIVKLLHQAGATVEVRSKDGTTPIILSAGHGHLELCRYLVEEAHCDVTATDAEGCDAATRAEQFGHGHVVAYLSSNSRKG